MKNKCIIFFLSMCMLLSACRDVSVVGEDFIESSNYELALTNSIPLNFSTMRFDSLATSEDDRLLIGGQAGTEFGDFSATSFFLINLVDTDFEFHENLVYDSLTLSINFDDYSVYLDEEVARGTIILEQLGRELEYPDDQSTLYNYSSVAGITDVPGNVLAEKDFFIASDRLRNQEVRLSDELGKDLFSKLENDSEEINDLNESRQYLKGFRLYLREPSFLLGIDKDSVQLRLHVTDAGTSSLENEVLEFSIGNSPNFVKYTHEEIPSNLLVEDQEDQVSSEVTDQQSLIVGGLGYATRIELTEIRDLLLDGEEFILVNAELRLRWLEQLHEDFSTPLVAQLVDEDLTDLALIQFPFTSEYDDEYGRDNFYVMDATRIVDFILNAPVGGEYFLLITSENFNSTPTSVALGDGTLDSEMNIYTIKN